MAEANYGLTVSQLKGFERLWSLTMKKRSKGEAAKAYKKINPDDELLNKMILALEAQNKYHRESKTEINFIKALGPWLNQYCWEDEIGSHADIKQKADQKKCDCGEPATNQGEGKFYCAECYSNTYDSWKQDLRKAYVENGLKQRPDETKEEWRKRLVSTCREKIRGIGNANYQAC